MSRAQKSTRALPLFISYSQKLFYSWVTQCKQKGGKKKPRIIFSKVFMVDVRCYDFSNVTQFHAPLIYYDSAVWSSLTLKSEPRGVGGKTRGGVVRKCCDPSGNSLSLLSHKTLFQGEACTRLITTLSPVHLWPLNFLMASGQVLKCKEELW